MTTLCQDIALLAQLPDLSAQATQLLALFAAQDVGAAAGVAISLLHPSMDGRGARLELSGKIFNTPPRTVQRDDLLPEFRRVRVPRYRHPDTLRSKRKGVHETAGTPTLDVEALALGIR
jgi:hypothetical protein